MTDKKIDSLKHKKAQRKRIPSREEAGYEADTPEARNTVASIPLNPVTHRGQDPELFWMHKYGEDDAQRDLEVDIRSLYRHEHIGPEKLIQRLYRLKLSEAPQNDMFAPSVEELFANYQDVDELDKPQSYYRHADRWSNRLIQGDSLMVMGSLLEREGMARQVQMIYIDPPYGIKYNSNWQMRMNDRNVKDGDDASLSGEPEVIKAFRDTWELGIHSYLTYLRDRLLVAKELLTESGSCFVQISDENVHLVRCVMDEVFGSENFCAFITVRKTTSDGSAVLGSTCDYLLWYAKNREVVKAHTIYALRTDDADSRYDQVMLANGTFRAATQEEKLDSGELPEGAKLYQLDNITSSRSAGAGDVKEFHWQGKCFTPGNGTFKTTLPGLEKLAAANRLQVTSNGKLRYRRFKDDFGYSPMNNLWSDISGAVQSRSDPKVYVVQSSTAIVERCMLLTTDPGDLVLDPTCGSGTTAHVAEQWGRRWITTDTSRIALNIAKTRIMTASYPWYVLEDEKKGLAREQWDVRHGFDYKKVQRVTLGSLANDEPPEEVTLYDQPALDKKKLRVAGPFTVETLQSFEPLAPDQVEEASLDHERMEQFQARVFEHLKTAGVKNGDKQQMAVFARVDALPEDNLHAEAYYDTTEGEKKAYIHLGPQFAPITKQAVNQAVMACRARGDADWLLILGFAFESDVVNSTQKQKAGSFRVDKIRMHDDLMQAGLTKKDRKAATFVTIGEPDIALTPALTPGPSPASGRGEQGEAVCVEIRGLDIYDPIKDEVKPRSVADIAYWMVDDDYDGSSFMVRQVFFCGGDKDEFDKWKRGLSDLAKASTKRKVEKTLKIEIEDEAFDRLYGFRSHPIPYAKGKKVAVRVISQFGEECTKVLTLA